MKIELELSKPDSMLELQNAINSLSKNIIKLTLKADNGDIYEMKSFPEIKFLVSSKMNDGTMKPLNSKEKQWIKKKCNGRN